MHDEVVPGLLKIGRHALAHHAEPDESYAHLSSPAGRKTAAHEFCRATPPSARITTAACSTSRPSGILKLPDSHCMLCRAAGAKSRHTGEGRCPSPEMGPGRSPGRRKGLH